MRLAFVVLGEPLAWQRARLSKTGHHYTEKKTRGWSYDCADLAAYHAIAQRFPRAYKGPCALTIDAVFQRPQTRMRKRDPLGRMWRETGAKDADNCGKLVMDSLQKAGVFVNDKQVVDLHVRLWWTAQDESPCVEIECLTIDPLGLSPGSSRSPLACPDGTETGESPTLPSTVGCGPDASGASVPAVDHFQHARNRGAFR